LTEEKGKKTTESDDECRRGKKHENEIT